MWMSFAHFGPSPYVYLCVNEGASNENRILCDPRCWSKPRLVWACLLQTILSYRCSLKLARVSTSERLGKEHGPQAGCPSAAPYTTRFVLPGPCITRCTRDQPLCCVLPFCPHWNPLGPALFSMCFPVTWACQPKVPRILFLEVCSNWKQISQEKHHISKCSWRTWKPM